jgi:hypothetical protein
LHADWWKKYSLPSLAATKPKPFSLTNRLIVPLEGAAISKSPRASDGSQPRADFPRIQTYGWPPQIRQVRNRFPEQRSFGEVWIRYPDAIGSTTGSESRTSNIPHL